MGTVKTRLIFTDDKDVSTKLESVETFLCCLHYIVSDAIGSKIGSTPSPAKCSQPKYRTKPHFGRAFCIYWTPRQQRISESWYR